MHPNRPGCPQTVLFATLFAAVLATAGCAGLDTSPPPQAQPVKMEWFGWSFFRFTSPNGKVILTNPYITGNPDASAKLDDITKADMILVPNGHGDEIGDTVAIAKATGARVVTPFELGTWFMGRGVPEAQVMRRSPGQRFVWEGITVRVVGSVHGSGSGRDAPFERAPIYGGPAAGFMVTFENGYTLYFPGSSAATQDMAMWAEAYKPDAMIFLMSTTSDPRDIGMAVNLVASKSPGLKTLLPHHHRVKPPAGAVTTSDVRTVLDSMGIKIPILNQERDKVYEFRK